MEVIKVEKVAKSFGGLDVLLDVSFSLQTGERAALIGPNGAGKTTLINILSGLLHATSGSIYFLGHNITNLPPYKRVALGLARSFQITSLFPALTLFENVLISLYGIQKNRYLMFRAFTGNKENNHKVKQLLESVGLWDKKDTLVSNLSHGEKRRLEIVLSISSQPRLLLLDEPNAGLSSDETTNLIYMIENLPASTTTLVIAHDLDFIYRLCKRVMVLYYGEIIADGSCKEIQANQKVRSIYLGREVKDARADQRS